MNTYEEQAIKFLNATGTTMTINYSHTDKYFFDDKESRDIYKVVLKRGERQFEFTFGNSINDSGFYIQEGKRKIEIDRKYLGLKAPALRRISGVSVYDKGISIHWPKVPTEYSILAALTKYDPISFDEFCSEFGYSTDSINALKIYEDVKKGYLNLCSLYNEEEMNTLREIQ